MLAAVGQPPLYAVMDVLPPLPPPDEAIEMLTLMLLPPPGWLKFDTAFVQVLMAVSTTLRASPALPPQTAAKLSDNWPRLTQVIVDGVNRSSRNSRYNCGERCLARCGRRTGSRRSEVRERSQFRNRCMANSSVLKGGNPVSPRIARQTFVISQAFAAVSWKLNADSAS